MTTTAPRGYDWNTSKTAQRYTAMRDALLRQNRTILYSMCNWGQARIDTWGNNTGHSWRMAGDILPEWSGKFTWHQSWGITNIINQAAFFWNTTNFWGHNDWDMLEVGNGALTTEENRSHFAMWAAFKSPLIIGAKLRSVSKTVLEILSNKELIAFNQDPVYGAGAMPYKWGYNKDGTYDTVHPAEYWTGTSVAGIHVFMLNTRDNSFKMTAKFSEIPALKAFNSSTQFIVHNMWTGKDIGIFTGEYGLDVAKHDTAALRITTADGKNLSDQYEFLFRNTSRLTTKYRKAPEPNVVAEIECRDTHLQLGCLNIFPTYFPFPESKFRVYTSDLVSWAS